MSSLLPVFGSLLMMFYGLCMYWSGNGQGNKQYLDGSLAQVGKLMSGTQDAHDKWIVVTTGTNSADDFKAVSVLTQIPGWRVVVVGDRNSASLCLHKTCVYLSLDDQSHLGLNIVPQLPKDSLARKNIGYLYAIAHGAKVIYETVAGNQPNDQLNGFILQTTTTGLSFNGAQMFNPYRHFGQVTLWPRGYPLNSVGDNDTLSYLLDIWKTPCIQQGLVNRNPEVDAIVHLTRKRKHSALNITFDSRAPPAFVPSGVFSPFNSHNTLFLYEAFWAMFLPVTTPRSVSDIWRGYWAQRLLWEIGGNIGFFPPNSILESNRNSKSADAEREHDMYFKTGSLVEFLHRWTCGSRETFFGCVTTLSEDMATQTFWGKEDARLIKLWIRDLRTIRYIEPERVPFSKKALSRRISKKKLRGRRNKSNLSRVQFVPEVEAPPGVDGTVNRHKAVLRQLDKASTICPKLDIETSMSGLQTKIYSNILLVIAFTNPKHYGVIKVYEALYSLHFPHTIYCGNMIASFHKISSQLKSPVTFVEADVRKGSLRQKCLIKAMEMNYKVDGYLFLSEDTLLNPWTLSTLPVDSVWYVKPISLSRKRGNSKHIVHKVQSRNMMKAFHKSQHDLELVNKTMFMRFRKQLWENTNFDDDGYLTQVTDVVYVPQRFRHRFLLYAKTFTRNGMFHDIAIPTAIGGIVNLKDVYHLDGHSSSRGNGRGFQQYFHKNFNYLHPVDFRKEMKNVDGVRFFCKTFLPLTLEG